MMKSAELICTVLYFEGATSATFGLRQYQSRLSYFWPGTILPKPNSFIPAISETNTSIHHKKWLSSIWSYFEERGICRQLHYIMYRNMHNNIQRETDLSVRLSMLINFKNNFDVVFIFIFWHGIIYLSICLSMFVFVIVLFIQSAISNILRCWNKDGWFDNIKIFKL